MSDDDDDDGCDSICVIQKFEENRIVYCVELCEMRCVCEFYLVCLYS